MKQSQKSLLIALAAALLGAALGAAGVWVAQAGKMKALESDLAVMHADLDDAKAVAESLTQRLSGEEATTSSATSSLTTTTAKTTTKTETVREFAYIRKLTVGSPGKLVADFAQFLTGDEAAEAAADAGEESPPPNDYYVLNENTKLRTFKIAKDAAVRLSSQPGEGFLIDGYESDVKTLADYIASDDPESASLRANGYWLTIKGDTVTEIEEQYTP